MSLEGVGVGHAERFLRPSTMPNALPDNCGVPAVRGSGSALATMLLGPPKGALVGMAGGARHVLVPPDHQGLVGRVHLGRSAVDTGQGD